MSQPTKDTSREQDVASATLVIRIRAFTCAGARTHTRIQYAAHLRVRRALLLRRSSLVADSEHATTVSNDDIVMNYIYALIHSLIHSFIHPFIFPTPKVQLCETRQFENFLAAKGAPKGGLGRKRKALEAPGEDA